MRPSPFVSEDCFTLGLCCPKLFVDTLDGSELRQSVSLFLDDVRLQLDEIRQPLDGLRGRHHAALYFSPVISL